MQKVHLNLFESEIIEDLMEKVSSGSQNFFSRMKEIPAFEKILGSESFRKPETLQKSLLVKHFER